MPKTKNMIGHNSNPDLLIDPDLLRNKGKMLRVKVRKYTGMKTYGGGELILKENVKDITKKGGKSFSVKKHTIAEEKIKKFNSLTKDMYEKLNPLLFDIDGAWKGLPNKNLPEALEILDDFKTEFNQNRDDLIEKYPQVKEDAKERLGEAYSDWDYPSVSEILGYQAKEDGTPMHMTEYNPETEKHQLVLDEEGKPQVDYLEDEHGIRRVGRFSVNINLIDFPEIKYTETKIDGLPSGISNEPEEVGKKLNARYSELARDITSNHQDDRIKTIVRNQKELKTLIKKTITGYSSKIKKVNNKKRGGGLYKSTHENVKRVIKGAKGRNLTDDPSIDNALARVAHSIDTYSLDTLKKDKDARTDVSETLDAVVDEFFGG